MNFVACIYIFLSVNLLGSQKLFNRNRGCLCRGHKGSSLALLRIKINLKATVVIRYRIHTSLIPQQLVRRTLTQAHSRPLHQSSQITLRPDFPGQITECRGPFKYHHSPGLQVRRRLREKGKEKRDSPSPTGPLALKREQSDRDQSVQAAAATRLIHPCRMCEGSGCGEEAVGAPGLNAWRQVTCLVFGQRETARTTLLKQPQRDPAWG